MGPLASSRRRSDVEGRVRAGVSDGARVVKGGGPRPAVRGYFYEPTVLADVTPAMPIAQEEICGPRRDRLQVPGRVRGGGRSPTTDSGWPPPCGPVTRSAAWTSETDRVGTFGVNLYEPDIGFRGAAAAPSSSGSAYGPEGMDTCLTAKSVFLPALRLTR